MATDAEQTEMVLHFSGVTGTPEDFAKTFLSDNGWQLEASVNQYMALMSDEMPSISSHSMTSHRHDMARNGMGAGDMDEDEALKNAIAQSQMMDSTAMDDDDDDDDDLYEENDDDDDDFEGPSGPPPHGARSGSDSAEGGGEGAKPLKGHMGGGGGSSNGAAAKAIDDPGTVMEPFRNFAAEGMAVPTSAAAAGGMESLFPPPADLMFQGNFNALRRTAEEQQKYCLVNVQKQDEFASHALNRDTWKDDKVKQVVGANFVFWQQQFESVGGVHYLSLYPTTELPLVDIIDPMTGALLDRIQIPQSLDDKTSPTNPGVMIERLTRFLDSHIWGRMGKQISTQQVTGMTQTQFHSIDGPGGADKRSRMSLENEDAALDAAIAASLQDSAPPEGCLEEDSARVRRQRSDIVAPEATPHTAYSDSLRVAQEMEFQQSLEADQEKERILKQAEEESELQKALEMSQEEERQRLLEERKASLPEEPASDGPGVTSLMLRLPDGSRKSRRFLSTEKLQVVYDFMFVNQIDPSQHLVATSYPRRTLDNSEQTLAELGLEVPGGSLLNVEIK